MADLPWAQFTSSRRKCNWAMEPSVAQRVLRCDRPSQPGANAPAILFDQRGSERRWDNPLSALGWLGDLVASRQLPAASRWVGFLGYDLGGRFEGLSSCATDDLRLPLFAFAYHDPTDPVDRSVPLVPLSGGGGLTSTFTRSAYEAAVERVIEYIRAGDVYQVNLSQRFTCGLPAQPPELFDRLRRQFPAAYAACLCYDDFAVVSNSPELFLRVETLPDGRRRVITRPVKGTRPRREGMDIELRDSRKDQAELAMIVDLERNDLGRVCEVGSVRVVEPRVIEAHPTVYHGVATIEGILRADVSFVDLLRATFPCGSVTGAPKIRAMQIIDELEPVRRGPYCGAIGYLAADGTIEFNVAIRTMILKQGRVHIPVGGGIVADSNPAAEYDETLVKAQAMFAAVGVDASEISRSE